MLLLHGLGATSGVWRGFDGLDEPVGARHQGLVAGRGRRTRGSAAQRTVTTYDGRAEAVDRFLRVSGLAADWSPTR